MLREIKFRGKREDNGEWIVGSYIYAFDMVHEHCIRCGTTYAVIPETVGQHGLTRTARRLSSFARALLYAPFLPTPMERPDWERTATYTINQSTIPLQSESEDY